MPDQNRPEDCNRDEQSDLFREFQEWMTAAPQASQPRKMEPSALEQEFDDWMTSPAGATEASNQAPKRQVANMLRDLLASLETNASAAQTEDAAETEILKLHRMLEEAGIPHKITPRFLVGGHHLAYYGHSGPPAPESGVVHGPGVGAACTVIQGPGTIGYEEGLLEISGLLTDEEYEHDSVIGGLTADDVFQRIRSHWLSEEA